MASRTALLITAAMAAVVVVVVGGALLPATASAAVYRVGDDSGWGLGVDYDAWASGKTFNVLDTLEFVYSPEGAHDVVVVDAASYEACAVPSNAPVLTYGDDTVTFGDAGQWHFICGVQGHCQSGMKLAVNVQEQ